MPVPRQAPLIARLVLVWFALFIGASIASPLVHPSAVQVVCSGYGAMKLVTGDNENADVKTLAGMECPLCASLATLPAAPAAVVPPPDGLSHALRPCVAAHLAWVTGSPLPPRGPPARA
jgi:hypothetical protein